MIHIVFKTKKECHPEQSEESDAKSRHFMILRVTQDDTLRQIANGIIPRMLQPKQELRRIQEEQHKSWC